MAWKSFFILVKLFLVKIFINFIFHQIWNLFNFLFFIFTIVLQLVVIILLQIYFILTYCIPSRSRDPLLKSKIKRKKLELVDKISSKPYVLAIDLESVAFITTEKFSKEYFIVLIGRKLWFESLRRLCGYRYQILYQKEKLF